MRTSGDGVCARQSFQGQLMSSQLTMSMKTECLAPPAEGSLCSEAAGSDCLLEAKAAVSRQQSKQMPGSACAARHVEQERQIVAVAARSLASLEPPAPDIYGGPASCRGIPTSALAGAHSVSSWPPRAACAFARFAPWGELSQVTAGHGTPALRPSPGTHQSVLERDALAGVYGAVGTVCSDAIGK